MLDFWEGKECAASPEAVLMQQLDALPTAHGESRCIHLPQDTRICRVVTVLGSTLVESPKARRGSNVMSE
jgi:hypothetical protein